jgi:hypothetical protein
MDERLFWGEKSQFTQETCKRNILKKEQKKKKILHRNNAVFISIYIIFSFKKIVDGPKRKNPKIAVLPSRVVSERYIPELISAGFGSQNHLLNSFFFLSRFQTAKITINDTI